MKRSSQSLGWLRNATECYGPGFPDCWTSRINGEEINSGLGDKVAAVCAYRDHRVKRWCFGWVLDLRTIQLSVTIPSISCFPTENGGCSMVSFDFQRLPSMASPSSTGAHTQDLRRRQLSQAPCPRDSLGYQQDPAGTTCEKGLSC